MADIDAEFDLSLAWSGSIGLALTSAAPDGDDAWGIPLEWSCVFEVDPPDDVEDA